MEGKFIPGDVESGTIDGLTENKSYEFRVRAVNKGGKGEPSDPTKPIIAKSRFGEFGNDRQTINEVSRSGVLSRCFLHEKWTSHC